MGSSESAEANQKCDFISHFESNTYREEEKKRIVPSGVERLNVDMVQK